MPFPVEYGRGADPALSHRSSHGAPAFARGYGSDRPASGSAVATSAQPSPEATARQASERRAGGRCPAFAETPASPTSSVAEVLLLPINGYAN